MPERLENFRFAFLPTFVLTLALGGMTCLLWLLIFYFLKLKSAGLPIGLAGAALTSLILAFVAVLYYPISVGAGGLHSFDAWGRYHRVPWSEITTVRPFRLLGLKYLRVFQAGQPRTIWVPLFLSDMNRFRSLVLQHAGSANPLSVALKMLAKQ